MNRILVAAIAGSALILTGCGVMPVPTALPTESFSASPTPSFTPTPTPTPTAVPQLRGEWLFTISATITSPGGATARLQQLVYQPSLPDDVDALEEQLDEECTGWRNTIGPAEFVLASITAKDTSKGGAKWLDDELVGVSMTGAPIFQGDFAPFQSFCSTVQLRIPGSVNGATPVPLHSGADDPGGWATLKYGFGIPYEPGTDPLDARRYPQLSNCRISLSPFAKTESAIAPTWLTTPQPHKEGCGVNHDGV